jgi:hypothetical protein
MGQVFLARAYHVFTHMGDMIARERDGSCDE